MTTVVYVHGTGVREPYYTDTFNLIEKELLYQKPQNLKLIRCYWGGRYGTKLHRNGITIPNYRRTGGMGSSNDDEIALWAMLYEDPLYELRLLAYRSSEPECVVPGQVTPGEELDERVERVNVSKLPALKAKLKAAGIADDLFDDARQDVKDSDPYDDALSGAPQASGEYREAVARAIVAQAMTQCEPDARILVDAVLRDQVVILLIDTLGGQARGMIDGMAKELAKLGLGIGLRYYAPYKRGEMTDAIYPFVGDILLYQGRGQQIRRFIHQRIEQATPPVVLLAHSLGGIASVDLLIMEKDLREQVSLLVTIGSQAPFLYEIDALYSLRYGTSLPEDFPSWLNIYDPRDFLSYVGEGVFPGEVKDVEVDNKLHFPESHSAYWTNPSVWKAIIERIP